MRLLNLGSLRHRMNVGLSLRCSHGRPFHTLYEFRSWCVRSGVTRLALLTRRLATSVRREGRITLGLLPPAALGSRFEAPSSVLVHATAHHGDEEEGHEAEDGVHRRRRY